MKGGSSGLWEARSASVIRGKLGHLITCICSIVEQLQGSKKHESFVVCECCDVYRKQVAVGQLLHDTTGMMSC